MGSGRSLHAPVAEIASALGGARPVEWSEVESGGYGRVSAHWRVLLTDGRAVFVKHALTGDARAWLRKERLVYERVAGSFLPAYLGFHDEAETLLVLEDLSAADWPPPWSRGRIDAVLDALRELHATEPPEGIEPLDAAREAVTGWGASLPIRRRCSPQRFARARGSTTRCRCSWRRPQTQGST